MFTRMQQKINIFICSWAVVWVQYLKSDLFYKFFTQNVLFPRFYQPPSHSPENIIILNFSFISLKCLRHNFLLEAWKYPHRGLFSLPSACWPWFIVAANVKLVSCPTRMQIGECGAVFIDFSFTLTFFVKSKLIMQSEAPARASLIGSHINFHAIVKMFTITLRCSRWNSMNFYVSRCFSRKRVEMRP